jgi:hypothetical protein
VLPTNDDVEEALKKRTLTGLYNDPPAWLRELHEELDGAVLEAYRLPGGPSEQTILAHLLVLNGARVR